MYFGNRNNTNIDDEFNENFISNILNFINKYKIILCSIVIIIIIIVICILSFNKKIINYLILIGDDIITIYEGSDYIEPGYKASNSSDEDLNKDVKITTNLDTKTVGEYEINYILNDIVKTRKVIVIEKPQVYTFVRLNAINNNINIYLKLGEEYKEPGYQVFSSTGKDLNDKVKIIGKVDISKKGTYTLVYSLIDENGVTISVTRTVTVMDTEISLTLSNIELTNQDIMINIMVTDPFFDYMILPDGSKTEKNNYSYKVSTNGNYIFKTYNKKGVVKEESKEVNNIDKTAPTGSCSGSYKNGKSTINIDASDNVEIKQYEINGILYAKTPMIINKELNNVTIKIYDMAGNTKDISCSLKNNNSPSSSSSSSKPSSSSSTNKSSSSTNSLYSFKKTYVNVTDLSCTVIYGKSSVVTKIAIDSAIAEQFHDILSSVCNYINSSPYIDKLQHAGAYVNREIKQHDYHSRGRAIDLNNIWTYTYNGKTYRPYSGQGNNTWNNYKRFICEVCDGKEDCKYNVNYIIYNRYFKSKGWCWGGNYGISYFDPMHFELRDDTCPVANKGKIEC